MAKLIPPTFLRIYVGMIVAVVATVVVTVFAVSFYLENDEIHFFLKDTDYIYHEVNTELLAGNMTPAELFAGETLYRYGYKLDWIAGTDSKNLCPGCDYISKYGNAELFWELPADNLLAIYTIKQFSGSLAIGLPLPYVPDVIITDEDIGLFEDPEIAATLGLLIIVLVVIGCVLYYPAFKLQKQIEQLNNTYKAFGQGKLSTRANEKIPQPVKQLAVNFNRMAEEISDTVKESQIFAQAVPHEMRTPLSRVQLATGLLRRKCDDPLQQELLTNIDTYVDDLNSLTSQVVAYSKLNSAEHEEAEQQKEAIQLAEFVCSRSKLLYAESDINITINCDESAVVHCYPVHIRLLLDNLLKNAMTYASQQVAVKVSYDRNRISLSVEDDGPGIPEDKYETIFIPFSRLDKSRNQKTGGLGLGLAIARNAARKINAELCVGRSKKLGGANFTITLR